MALRKLLKSVIVVVACALTALPAMAADFFYDHNGSRMRVNVQGPEVRIFYQQPRSGLQGVGVRSGTLLFDGRVANGYLEGMSRIFNRRCGEVDYFVYGDFQPGRTFTLTGAAPVLSQTSCRIVDNVYEGSNANLVFSALGARPLPQPNPAPTPTPAGSGCVMGVNTTLNVRVGPGSSFGRIGELRANSCGVVILDRCQDGWCAIQQGNTTGWVSMRYIRR
ncbi:MAG: SH3 domain-containing protein [Pseudomonadota bacterium]